VYACLDGTAWTSLSKCAVSVSGERTFSACRAKGSREVVVAGQLLDGTQPELSSSQVDEDGRPCYVVVWVGRAAFPSHDPAVARVGTAFRFYSGSDAEGFVAACSGRPGSEAGTASQGRAGERDDERGAWGSRGGGTIVTGLEGAEGDGEGGDDGGGREEDDKRRSGEAEEEEEGDDTFADEPVMGEGRARHAATAHAYGSAESGFSLPEVEEAGEDDDVDIDVTPLLRLPAELLRRTEDAEAAGAAPGSLSRITRGPLAGWSRAGSGSVQIVRIRQRYLHHGGGAGAWSSADWGDDSAREWEAAARGDAVPGGGAGLSPTPGGGARPAPEAEVFVELLFQRGARAASGSGGGAGASDGEPGDANAGAEAEGSDLLLRHGITPDLRVLPAHAAAAKEEGVSEGAAASGGSAAALASSLLLEADDEKLGSGFDGDLVPFMLRFESPVDAARFRAVYDRARGANDEDADSDAAALALAADADPPELMERADARVRFVELFRETPFAVARALSSSERHAKGLVAPQLAYAEVRFDGMAEVLRVIREDLVLPAVARGGGKFVDLGSGVGKALLAAVLTHTFDECVGIEILQGLHESAVATLDRFDRDLRPLLPAPRRRVAVQLVRDDFCRVPWLDADVVLCVSTTFDAAVMSRIAALSNDMRVGSVLVTTTTRLPSARWAMRQRLELAMAHGPVTAFIHEKQMA